VTAPVVNEPGDGVGEHSGNGHMVAAEPDEHLLPGAGDQRPQLRSFGVEPGHVGV
jgi:hypothetical protein